MLPLEGVRVIEFAHMVMGPSCGLVLARAVDDPILSDSMLEATRQSLIGS